VGCLVGLGIGVVLAFVLLAWRGSSIAARVKTQARKILGEGRITDAAEFARVTKSLARAPSDREAADLLRKLHQLKDREGEPASSQHTTKQTVRSGPTSPSTSSSVQHDRFVEVMPTPKPEASQHVGGVSITIHYETGGTSFFREAQSNHDRDEDFAEPVPFMRYWPTYAAMDRAQQRWYFYWRSQVRQNNYLPSDLSYIFLHVYETINLVENPDPDAAARHIWQLWQKYRAQHPRLDNYLPDWGGDLLGLKKGVDAGILWWQKAAPVIDRPPIQIVNLIIHQLVESGRTAEIPYEFWAILMDYRPRNKFYKEHNTHGQLDRAYEKAIHVAEEYWQESSGQPLLAEFTSPVLYSLRKPVFTSALVGYTHPEALDWGKSRNYMGDARLSKHLTSVVKYAENILRKQAKFSSRLSGITLDAGLSQALDAAFLPTVPLPKPFKITIDQARVADIISQSERIGAILEPSSAGEMPTFAKPLYTDLAEMRQLWAILEISDRLILAAMHQREITTVQALTRHLAAHAVLPNMFIDHINEQALELLGDRLIYPEEGDMLCLAEDYLDELDVVIAESPPESRPSGPATFSADGPWDHFFAKLAPAEIALIRLFAENGRLAEADIAAATRPYNVMANAALDSLNEKGADALGHPPLYLDGEQWLVEEDDMVALRHHLSGGKEH